ncbi:MAG: histidinol-phosphate transaminase [Candidatus Omnitrophica bacterium]|nr:histidinol-phosphate transaminase [Candidatus Omnitrophota bacterium]
MKPLARKVLQDLSVYSPGKPVEEVERELGIPRAIKLASNENPLGPSPKALEAIRNALPHLNRYPDSHCFYLKERLSRHMGVGTDQLIVGNGSDELITFAARAFLEPGDEVVIAEPTFLIYRIAAQIAGAKVRVVRSKEFRYDLEGMRRALTPRTKLVFIANPDNPTGTYVTRAEVEEFMKGLPEGVIVFFDEAYAELVEAPDYPDGREYIPHHAVIVTRTFSKAYGLSGIRVGYGMSRPDLIGSMQKVREPFNVNSLAQAAALAALDDAGHLEATRRLLREQKPLLYRALEEMGFRAVPSAANFILFHAGPRAVEIARALLKRGVIVREMLAWNLPEHIRVTVGLPEENQAFITALKETTPNGRFS